jgi:hypothetical protein
MYIRLDKWAAQIAVGMLTLFTISCMPVQFSAQKDDTSTVVPEASPTPTPTGTPIPSPSPTVSPSPTTSPTASPSPSASPTASPSPSASPTPTRDVTYVKAVEATAQKVDIVLVVDDSNSMLADNQKLAARLTNFVTLLQNSSIDWQMCATVTRALPITATTSAWGASIYWQSSATASSALGIVLRKGQANLSSIFANTINYINAGWVGSDDERAIKAAYRHVYNGDYNYSGASGCYRQGAATSYIIISDEDERSIGGDASQQVYAGELKALETEDLPAELVRTVKATFGDAHRFTVNSIIVKPGDTACKTAQDAGTAKSHYGFRYAELSNLTGGGIGSICDADYNASLKLFFDRIANSLSSIPLECVPVGAVNVSVSPSVGTVTTSVSGMNLVFATPVSEGHTITLNYKCYVDSRSPSSVEGAKTAAPSFWMSIMNFFKNLF